MKLSYENSIGSATVQTDITEKGFALKEAYFKVASAALCGASFQAGIFGQPFGYEVEYSSALREAPERSTVSRTLFPSETDIGAKLTWRPSAQSFFHFLQMDAGIFSGNGVASAADSYFDYMGRLSADVKTSDNTRLGLALSYCNGLVVQFDESVFMVDDTHTDYPYSKADLVKKVRKEYIGAAARFSTDNKGWNTRLQCEYVTGRQPGSSRTSVTSTDSEPVYTIYPDNYNRRFAGGYLLWVQQLGALPLSLETRYDFYDPNTEIKGEDANPATDIADLSWQTLGVGMLWEAAKNIRVQAHCDFIWNEHCSLFSDYAYNRPDNVFTLRLQYAF